jgi:hypothetical protein
LVIEKEMMKNMKRLGPGPLQSQIIKDDSPKMCLLEHTNGLWLADQQRQALRYGEL